MSHPPKLTDEHALFLDFDGTLVEIAPKPDAVVVEPRVHEALAAASDTLKGALAVITGRTLENITGHLAPTEVPIAGSHGIERLLPDGRVEQPGEDVRATAEAIRSALKERLEADQEGLIFEAKDWSAALHYRQRPELEELCRQTINDVVSDYPEWEVLPGDMNFEARLKGPSKASAVDLFMEMEPFYGRVPVFVGDDVTDEDGMRAARDRGGYGIKVGEGESLARYRLEGPQQVLDFLLGADLTSGS